MKKYQYLASWDDQTLTRVGEPVVVLGDSNVSQVEVTLPSDFLLDPTKAECRMYFMLPGKKESDHDVLETATKDDNGDSHVTWTIKHVHSQKGGRLAFSLALIGDDAQWDSRTAIIPVYESRYQPESEEAEKPYTGRLEALEGSMAAIRGEFAEVQEDFEDLKETATLGTPIPESLVANMQEGHVYIYTGNETGYTAGHVYYYVGGALTDGGVYGGTAVDATLTQSGQAADAKKTGDEISQIKEDLIEVENFSVSIDSGINVGTLTTGSYIIPNTGAHGALAYGFRSDYVDIIVSGTSAPSDRRVPLMFVAGFDRTIYKYTIYGYTAHSVSSASESFTGRKWTQRERVFILPKNAATKCIRFSVIRIDGQGTITAEQAAEIASNIKIMRMTDAELAKAGVPADALATGAAIEKIKALNLLPPTAAGSTTSAGVTFVSDGAGNYTISGSQYEQSQTAFYYLYHSETALLDGITPGNVFQLRAAIKVQVPIQIRFYNGTSWTLVTETLSDAEFTAPADSVGMSVRFIGRYGTKYTEDLATSACHPEIVRINSAGYFRAPERTPQIMLTIIDDDGYSAFYTDLLPVVRSKHVPITSAVICKRIDDTNNYMTWTQVQEAYLAGADIVSHTFEHITPEAVIANNVTVEELTEDYVRAYNDLSVHGIISPALVFNNDSAKYGKQQEAARAVYDYAFSNQKTGTISNVINHRGTTAPYNILRYDITPTTGTTRTLAELKEMIDTLVANSEGWLVWMTHTSDEDWPGSSEATKLSDAIDYALANGVKVVSCMTGIKYVMT